MLSTGEEKDLEVARGWVKEAVARTKDVDLGANPHAWNNGYSGLGLCEYYLRTGDQAVLPLIEIGSFGIIGGDIQGVGSGRYDTPMWGTGLALSYTMPRKTLRMTGAPATRFCKSYQLPKRPWGNAADDVFYSLVPAPDRNGKIQNVDGEKLLTDASAPIWRKLADPKISAEFLAPPPIPARNPR